MKILIIRFSSIGDIVLTSPVVRCIKKQLEGSEIHFATKEKYRELVEHNPYISKVHVLENSLRKLTSSLIKEKFNYVIDLHHNLRSLIVKSRLGVKSYSLNKLNFEKWMLVTLKINKLPDLHIVNRYLETVKKIGVENDGEGLDFFIPDKDKFAEKDLPDNFRKGYIAFAIGAQHQTKKLPIDKIKSIIENIHQPIVLLGDKNDLLVGKNIVESFELFAKRKQIYNACGRLNINQSASVLANARKVITHDTGLMHIASAFQKEIISVWGNTVPQFGMYPYLGSKGNYDLSHIIEVKNLKCRPCSKLGYSSCPEGHFKCMAEIDENKITKIISKR